jgi:trigger factor
MIPQSEIYSRSINKAVTETLKQLNGSKEFEELEIIEDSPKVDIPKINEKELVIDFTYESNPEIKIGDLKQIKILAAKEKITKEIVDAEFDKLIKRYVMLVPKEDATIEKGDVVTFDFKGYDGDVAFPGGEAKDYELEIGSGNFIPGFEEQMIGFKSGDKKSIEVSFPDTYHEKSLAGKPVKFELDIHDVKTKKMPIMDEEFISKFGVPEVKTEEQLRGHIEKQLNERNEYNYKQNAVREISEQIVKLTKISHLPNVLIQEEKKKLDKDTENKASQRKISKDEYIKKFLGYQTKEAYESAVLAGSETNVTLALAISQLIDDYKIEVSNEEIEAQIEKLSKVYGMSVEELKNKLNGNTDQIYIIIQQEKLFEKLIDNLSK